MGSNTQFLHNLSSFLYTTSSGCRLHCSRKSMSVWRPCSFRQKTSGGISTRVCKGAGRSGDLAPLTKQRVRRRVRLGEPAHLRQLAAFGDLKASGLMPGDLKKGVCDHLESAEKPSRRTAFGKLRVPIAFSSSKAYSYVHLY